MNKRTLLSSDVLNRLATKRWNLDYFSFGKCVLSGVKKNAPLIEASALSELGGDMFYGAGCCVLSCSQSGSLTRQRLFVCS